MNRDLSSEEQAELSLLVERMWDFGLDKEQSQKLNEMLREDAALDFYLDYVNLLGELSWRYRGQEFASSLTLTPASDPQPAATQYEPKSTERLAAEAITLKPARRRIALRYITALASAACILLIGGAYLLTSIQQSPRIRPSEPPGSEIPDETNETIPLKGTTLRLVGNQRVSWVFEESSVVISASEGMLPAALVTEILDQDISVAVIGADWEWGQSSRELRFFNFKVDSQGFDREVKLEIERAGAIRVNLGRQQYNLFRE